ncbi:hypothetical protein J437_LFUL016231 [Ladona fulva]|uniref:Uncharacterized protein n=1 Tax=Ladona fulva TaxID=123851 RepID=A0A8K0P4S5_LADFU|nr:hypothetical protein J437_LFUL016231 [Ladona fulva]
MASGRAGSSQAGSNTDPWFTELGDFLTADISDLSGFLTDQSWLEYSGFDPIVILRTFCSRGGTDNTGGEVTLGATTLPLKADPKRELRILLLVFAQRGASLDKIIAKSNEQLSNYLRNMKRVYNLISKKTRRDYQRTDITLGRLAASAPHIVCEIFHSGHGRCLVHLQGLKVAVPPAMQTPSFAQGWQVHTTIQSALWTRWKTTTAEVRVLEERAAALLIAMGIEEASEELHWQEDAANRRLRDTPQIPEILPVLGGHYLRRPVMEKIGLAGGLSSSLGSAPPARHAFLALGKDPPGAVACSNLLGADLDRLQVVQNACLRYALRPDTKDHITPLYRREKILKVWERKRLNIIFSGLRVLEAPTYVLHNLCLLGARHLFDTRNSQKLFRILSYQIFRMAGAYATTFVREFNELPPAIRRVSALRVVQCRWNTSSKKA